MKIRRMNEDEFVLLEKFLYNAIYQVEGDKPLAYDIIYEPQLRIYISDFGRIGDYCIVAEDEQEQEVVGAVWSRLFCGEDKGYGYVDDMIPELSISVLKDYRGRGIGRQLMVELLGVLAEEGYDRVSLSVQKVNYAAELYKSLGFRVFRESDDDYIMLVDL